MAIRKDKYDRSIFNALCLLSGNDFPYPLDNVNLSYKGTTIPVIGIDRIHFKNDILSGLLDKSNVSVDILCEDCNYTFDFSSSGYRSRGWDDLTGESPRLMNAEIFCSQLESFAKERKVEIENQRYKDSIISLFEAAYKVAKPTNELIKANSCGIGERAEFDDRTYWNRKLDFKVPFYPDFKGLRYLDFPYKSMDIYVLYNDGKLKSANELTKRELSDIREGLSVHLRKMKNNGISM